MKLNVSSGDLDSVCMLWGLYMPLTSPRTGVLYWGVISTYLVADNSRTILVTIFTLWHIDCIPNMSCLVSGFGIVLSKCLLLPSNILYWTHWQCGKIRIIDLMDCRLPYFAVIDNNLFFSECQPNLPTTPQAFDKLCATCLHHQFMLLFVSFDLKNNYLVLAVL